MVAHRRRRYSGGGRPPKAHAGGPPQMAPGLVGVPRPGATYPSKHESAILRRLGQPGAFLLVTFRQDRPPVFCYGDTGEVIRNEHRADLTERDFRRLQRWLIPVKGESLFEPGPAQRWLVKRVS